MLAAACEALAESYWETICSENRITAGFRTFSERALGSLRAAPHRAATRTQ